MLGLELMQTQCSSFAHLECVGTISVTLLSFCVREVKVGGSDRNRTDEVLQTI